MTKGTYPLDEIDGQLFLRGIPIAPVPAWEDRLRGGPADLIAVWAHGSSHRALERATGIQGWYSTTAIYQCAHCKRWAIGSTITWCSPECRRLGCAQRERERRAKQAAERIEALAALNCTVCGKPLEATRKTRAYCSDRCRQWAHRHPLTAPAARP